MAKLLNHWNALSLINLYLYLQSLMTVGETPENDAQMRAGAPFNIVLFADLHFGESAWTEWGPLQDVNSSRVMSTVLDAEAPDLVIYLGDVITANNIAIANASLYWDQAISPTRARGIPWASVFGNHDDAAFEWPLEWFSSPGIPQLRCQECLLLVVRVPAAVLRAFEWLLVRQADGAAVVVGVCGLLLRRRGGARWLACWLAVASQLTHGRWTWVVGVCGLLARCCWLLAEIAVRC